MPALITVPRPPSSAGLETHEAVLMTPEWAAELLASNPENRAISRGHVAALAADMAAGKWMANGSSIVVARGGMLLDGQHRLMACIAADAAFPTVLSQGVDLTARQTIDTGRKRTAGDAMKIEGIANYKNAAASIRLLAAYPSMAEGVKVTNAAAIEFHQSRPVLALACDIVRVDPDGGASHARIEPDFRHFWAQNSTSMQADGRADGWLAARCSRPDCPNV
jgi:hypothetical protein